MQIIRPIALGALCFLATSVLAQNSEDDKNNNSGMSKRIENYSEDKNKTNSTEVTPTNSSEKANPYNRVNATEDQSARKFSPSTPATKTNSNNKITEIKYVLENSNPTIVNLLNLLEIKQRINDENNQVLLNSNEYKTLLTDISKLRLQFDNEVKSKGLKNCSKIEQSYYLSFLKEENRIEEYQSAINELN